MKKCNFFSVLLVALFILLGFESNAQSYKSIQEAKVIVTEIVSAANVAENSPTTSIQSTASASSNDIFRIKIGKSLLKQLNNNIAVSVALSNVETEFSNFATGGKASAKNAVLLQYTNALKI